MPQAVTMTLDEQAVVQAAADKALTLGQLSKMVWEPSEMAGFVNLKARPCPLLIDVSGKPVCSIRESRPYSCRRFMCLRPEPEQEPLQFVPLTNLLTYGNVGVINLRERLVHSRVARRMYEKNQRKAMRWADKHGWTRDEARP